MAPHDTVTAEIEGIGKYRVRAEALDLMMSLYLPASINELTDKIRVRHGLSSSDQTFGNLSSVTACLVILAKLDGYSVGVSEETWRTS